MPIPAFVFSLSGDVNIQAGRIFTVSYAGENSRTKKSALTQKSIRSGHLLSLQPSPVVRIKNILFGSITNLSKKDSQAAQCLMLD
jgi:hypothetical protein